MSISTSHSTHAAQATNPASPRSHVRQSGSAEASPVGFAALLQAQDPDVTVDAADPGTSSPGGHEPGADPGLGRDWAAIGVWTHPQSVSSNGAPSAVLPAQDAAEFEASQRAHPRAMGRLLTSAAGDDSAGAPGQGGRTRVGMGQQDIARTATALPETRSEASLTQLSAPPEGPAVTEPGFATSGWWRAEPSSPSLRPTGPANLAVGADAPADALGGADLVGVHAPPSGRASGRAAGGLGGAAMGQVQNRALSQDGSLLTATKSVASSGRDPNLFYPSRREEARLAEAASTALPATELAAATAPVSAGLSVDRRGTSPGVSRDDPLGLAPAMASGQPAEGLGPEQTVNAAAPTQADQASAETVSYWVNEGGTQHAQVRIDDAERGPLDVAIAMQGDQATVDFRTDQPELRAALDQSAPTLRDLLAEQGLSLTGVSVGGSDTGAGARSWQDRDTAGGFAAARSARIRPTALEPRSAATQSRRASGSGQTLDVFA